jgi:exopolysaccharide biosynthesis polyprenyl glycosylphosphotransferase
MLKQRSEQFQALARGLDLLVCIAAFFAAYAIRSSGPFGQGAIEPIESLTWFLGASVVAHLVIYPVVGFYESLRMKSLFDIAAMVVRAAVIEFFVLGSMVFLIQAKTTSRYFFGLFLVINYSVILAEKIGVRFVLSSIRRRGYNFRQILVVGSGDNAERIIQTLQRSKHWGYVPMGVLAEEKGIANVESVPVLGRIGDLEEIIKSKTVDEVVFALQRIDADEVSGPLRVCEKLGIPIRFSLGFLAIPRATIAFTQIDQVPLVTFHTTLRTPFEEFWKRLIDIVISVVGLAVTGLLLPWIYWKVRRESPGPLFFKQPRVGENGRTFRCYKFRTMRLDAEERKSELMAKNVMQGPIFKIEDDPRVFPFGNFMRRTSIDELPQFLNVLRGDMSVVGTRPPTPDEVRLYETHYRKRLSIRPGVTGLWQVSGRNDIRDFEDILKLDMEYIERWSIGLDLRIIFRTIWVIFFRRGAY